jgi:hypothetical protein
MWLKRAVLNVNLCGGTLRWNPKDKSFLEDKVDHFLDLYARISQVFLSFRLIYSNALTILCETYTLRKFFLLRHYFCFLARNTLVVTFFSYESTAYRRGRVSHPMENRLTYGSADWLGFWHFHNENLTKITLLRGLNMDWACVTQILTSRLTS